MGGGGYMTWQDVERSIVRVWCVGLWNDELILVEQAQGATAFSSVVCNFIAQHVIVMCIGVIWYAAHANCTTLFWGNCCILIAVLYVDLLGWQTISSCWCWCHKRYCHTWTHTQNEVYCATQFRKGCRYLWTVVWKGIILPFVGIWKCSFNPFISQGKRRRREKASNCAVRGITF